MKNHCLQIGILIFLASCGTSSTSSHTLTQTDIPTLAITSTPAKTLLPIDGKIAFSIEEMGGVLTLKLQTETIYSSLSNVIDVTVDTSISNVIQVKVLGIVECRECAAAIGPARKDIPLGVLEGNYDLEFQYSGQSQVYTLSVSSTQISLITQVQGDFMMPRYPEWRRLPNDSLWVAVHNEGVYDGKGNWQLLEWPTYRELAGRFFEDLEELGASMFLPVEGHYSNYLFIPPWENWHERTGDRVIIPLEQEGWYEFRWPDIRYYHYGGSWEQVEELVEAYKETGLSIYGYDWSGSNIFAVKVK